MISYMYTHSGTEVSRVQSHPLENMICLAAGKLTITLFYITLLNSLVDGKLGGSSGANFPMKIQRLLQVIYHILIVQPTSIKP